VLDTLPELPLAPRLVVFSRAADNRLWGEVLNLGAYDLLMFPFERPELLRVADLAGEAWALEQRKCPGAARGAASGLTRRPMRGLSPARVLHP
jgi:hypothetical protein